LQKDDTTTVDPCGMHLEKFNDFLFGLETSAFIGLPGTFTEDSFALILVMSRYASLLE
jgi:hypothetical protein